MLNPNKTDLLMINRAINISKKSQMYHRHGCIIASNKKILSSGYNHYRTKFSLNKNYDNCSCHAEMHALQQIYKTVGLV